MGRKKETYSYSNLKLQLTAGTWVPKILDYSAKSWTSYDHCRFGTLAGVDEQALTIKIASFQREST